MPKVKIFSVTQTIVLFFFFLPSFSGGYITMFLGTHYQSIKQNKKVSFKMYPFKDVSIVSEAQQQQ